VFGIHFFRADASDSVSHFAPMLLAQVVAASWISEGRILPIMTDVQQLLIAPEIIRAVVGAIFARKEKKFNVTAKGVMSDKVVIHGSLICRFGVLIGANIFGVAYFVLVSNSDWIASGAVGALLWTWYNLIVLILSCLVCIEQPRRRQHERHELRREVLIEVDDGERHHFSLDLSVGGMSFEGPPPGPIGSKIRVRFAGLELAGVVCRESKAEFAMMFTDHISREAVSRFIYNEAVCNAAAQTKLGRLVASLVNRAAA
jgi:cellulose synthase (UDP-forming)